MNRRRVLARCSILLTFLSGCSSQQAQKTGRTPEGNTPVAVTNRSGTARSVSVEVRQRPDTAGTVFRTTFEWETTVEPSETVRDENAILTSDAPTTYRILVSDSRGVETRTDLQTIEPDQEIHIRIRDSERIEVQLNPA